MAPITIALRIAQGVNALLILALSAYVANWYNMDTLTASPSQINFLIFAPIFTFISLVYLEVVPRFMPRASNKFVGLALGAVNVLFYLGGFIALSVFLSKLLFCRGSVCGAARASAAFSGIQFSLWAITTAIALLEAFGRGGAHAAPRAGNMREKAGAMA